MTLFKSLWQGFLSHQDLLEAFPWHYLQPPVLVAVEGPMGAGKTTWIQSYVFRWWGIQTVSPSFQVSILLAPRVYHWDLYRVQRESHLEALDFWSLIENVNETHLVEWAGRWILARPINRPVAWVSIQPGSPQGRFYGVGLWEPR